MFLDWVNPLSRSYDHIITLILLYFRLTIFFGLLKYRMCRYFEVKRNLTTLLTRFFSLSANLRWIVLKFLWSLFILIYKKIYIIFNPFFEGNNINIYFIIIILFNHFALAKLFVQKVPVLKKLHFFEIQMELNILPLINTRLSI